MGKHKKGRKAAAAEGVPYKEALRRLQVSLVRLQRRIIEERRRVLLIFEGRDTAGKDGTIDRIVRHLSPREARVVALPRPSDREAAQWYFQRYVPHLPAAGEITLFNRSWYNRAGVEPVMGFCTDAEYEAFLQAVGPFEAMLAEDGIEIVKYYLDIDRTAQKARLEARAEDPLKQWKLSPIDHKSLKRFDAYTQARDAMLRRTDSARAPWVVVRADDKKAARLGVIHDLIARLAREGADEGLAGPDPAVVRRFDETCIREGFLAS